MPRRNSRGETRIKVPEGQQVKITYADGTRGSTRLMYPREVWAKKAGGRWHWTQPAGVYGETVNWYSCKTTGVEEVDK